MLLKEAGKCRNYRRRRFCSTYLQNADAGFSLVLERSKIPNLF